MTVTSKRALAAGALSLCLAIAAGCEDRRYVVEPPVAPGTELVPDRPGVDIDVNTPAGRVKVDGATSQVAPHRDVKVDVGGGKVEVDIDGKPVLERIRERREERQLEVNPPTP